MRIDSKSLGLFVTSLLFVSCVHQRHAQSDVPKRSLLEVRVQAGDTLRQLERRFSVPLSTLQRVNKLSYFSELKAGQILYIPVSEKALQSADLRGKPRSFDGKSSDLGSDKGRRAQLYTAYRQLSWPVEGRVGSVFGMRHGRQHAGIDILSQPGERIRAVHPGLVEFVGWKRGYGKTLILKHEGFRTLYAHCSSVFGKVGQRVNKGQEVAIVGQSGNAEGIHLHFEYLTLAGKAVDPLPHFSRTLAH